jgi:hypothetical protein
MKEVRGWVLVAHACNPGYSGSREQEDCGLKPAGTKSSRDLASKNPSLKKRELVE